MGSLNASGISVVAKDNVSYRVRSARITATASEDDTVTTVTSHRHDLIRPLGSGSIVRDNGTTSYFDEVVWGGAFQARFTTARIASAVGASRTVFADTSGNVTIAVVEDSLQNENAQEGWVHTGNRLVGRQSVGDTLIARTANSGSIDPAA